MNSSPSVDSSGFRFDPVEHRYWSGTRQIPGITRVLDLTGFIDKTWFTDGGRARGNAVHRACWYLAEDDLDWSTVKPEYISRVEEFGEFLNDIKEELILAETPLFSMSHQFGGTPDFVFKVGSAFWIVDVKSGEAGLAAELQTAAQEILVRELPEFGKVIFQRFALELPAEGKYRLIPHKNPYDRSMFLSALGMVHRRINAGELKL